MSHKEKIISEANFHKLAECYRELSAGILDDRGIVSEYNTINNNTKRKISNELKKIKNRDGLGTNEQFWLNIVEIHIIAIKYNIDPATVCCIGGTPENIYLIRLITEN